MRWTPLLLVVPLSSGACGDDSEDTGGGSETRASGAPEPTGGSSGDPSSGVTEAGSAGTAGETEIGSTSTAVTDETGTGDGDRGSCADPAPAPAWTPNVRINDDGGTANQTEVVLATGRPGVVLAGWVDYRSGGRCGFAVSNDYGDSWSENFLIQPQGSGITGDPVVGSDAEGNLYIACQDYSTSEIRFTRSADDGWNWETVRSVMDSPDKPWIAGASDGILFLTRLGEGDNYQRSPDGGVTWEAGLPLGWVGHGTAIAAGNEGTVHIAYNTTGDQMGYARSSDWGATLEGTATLGTMGSACYGCEPRDHPITAGAADPTGSVVALVWSATMSQGDLADDVWALISRDRGTTWSERIRVNDTPLDGDTRQFQPWVAVDECGEVHVIWTDFRDGGTPSALYYASTDDPEAGFGPSMEVTDDVGTIQSFHGDYKGLVVQRNWVMAAWSDFRNGHGDIYFSRSPHARTGTLPGQTRGRTKTSWTTPQSGATTGPPPKYISTRPPQDPAAK